MGGEKKRRWSKRAEEWKQVVGVQWGVTEVMVGYGYVVNWMVVEQG